MSLHRSLIYWLLPPLLLMFSLNAVLAYYDALHAVNLAYDRSLAASIRAIGERIYVKDGGIQTDIPYAALEAFEGGDQERVFYVVIGPDGKPLTGYSDLPVAAVSAQLDQVQASNGAFRGDAIRMGVMRKRLYGPELGGKDEVRVVVAETIESRQALVRELFFESLKRDGLMIVIVALSLALSLATAFRPLIRLRNAISNRGDDDLEPIPQEAAPSEVRPLIEAINQHTARIARMLKARKRFLADAAHQLRTPLAVLSTQVDYGLRQTDPAEQRQTLEGLRESIRRMRHMTNQMLSLSRAESANGLVLEQVRVDLAPIVREAALEITPLALEKSLELAYQGPERGMWIKGHAGMLHEMVLNVLDNAVRYTPRAGSISIVLCKEGGTGGGAGVGSVICLDITDSGPGIPVEERENAFARFHRLLAQGNSQGSGLGLSIVREICLAHQGNVSLADGPDGKGLRVAMRFTAEPKR